jgi:hypothetical protein
MRKEEKKNIFFIENIISFFVLAESVHFMWTPLGPWRALVGMFLRTDLGLGCHLWNDMYGDASKLKSAACSWFK